MVKKMSPIVTYMSVDELERREEDRGVYKS
jgi:hypothetical protein